MLFYANQLRFRPTWGTFPRTMKCHSHPTEAVGICAYCGRGVCLDCAQSAASGPRLVCSPACASALVRVDLAMKSILQKSEQSARASSYYSYLCAALSAGGSIGAVYYLPHPYLMAFTSACAVIFLASGFWYGRIARKQVL